MAGARDREPHIRAPINLTIPDPALVLLVGPSGAGKSTFAAAHFRPTEIVSSDNLRAMLTDDEGDQAASAEAFRLLTLIAHGRLKRRLTTVVDATNLRRANRRKYAAIATGYGVPTVAIAFDLASNAYHARNAARLDRTVHPEVVEDQATRMADVLADLPGEGYAALYVLSEAELGNVIDVVRPSAPGPAVGPNRRGGAKPMLVLDLTISAEQVLEECGRRGLVVRSQRQLAGRAGSRHWHLRFLGRPGTLELNSWGNRVWVNVHPLRDGGWATALAEELSLLEAG